MDRRKNISFTEISKREKQDIFRLDAVRRSMRSLDYALFIMTPEILQLSEKYMEIGPNRASLLHIGYDSIAADSSSEETSLDEMSVISPKFLALGMARGYHPVTYTIALLSGIGEMWFYIVYIQRGGPSVVNVTSLLGCLLLTAFNASHSFKKAFKPGSIRQAKDCALEEISITNVSYLRCKGLEVLALAQERIAKGRVRQANTSDQDSGAKKYRRSPCSDTLSLCRDSASSPRTRYAISRRPRSIRYSARRSASTVCSVRS